jgi:hypothetical protein
MLRQFAAEDPSLENTAAHLETIYHSTLRASFRARRAT